MSGISRAEQQQLAVDWAIVSGYAFDHEHIHDHGDDHGDGTNIQMINAVYSSLLDPIQIPAFYAAYNAECIHAMQQLNIMVVQGELHTQKYRNVYQLYTMFNLRCVGIIM